MRNNYRYHPDLIVYVTSKTSAPIKSPESFIFNSVLTAVKWLNHRAKTIWLKHTVLLLTGVHTHFTLPLKIWTAEVYVTIRLGRPSWGWVRSFPNPHLRQIEEAWQRYRKERDDAWDKTVPKKWIISLMTHTEILLISNLKPWHYWIVQGYLQPWGQRIIPVRSICGDGKEWVSWADDIKPSL